MERIKKIVYGNENIEESLKDKVFECVSLILTKYPEAYQNLYTNLSNIKIRYTTLVDKKRLNKNRVDSSYNYEEKLLIVDKFYIDSPFYKNILVHELLHVSSHKGEDLGFENLKARRGKSFNEGMTEYLTQEILGNHSFGISKYLNDVNNIVLLSIIIPINKLVELYFNKGLVGLFNEYLSITGTRDELARLIVLMDTEHMYRVYGNNFNNPYKKEYISYFFNDIKDKEYKSKEECLNAIGIINSFAKYQYKTEDIPNEIKESWEECIKKILESIDFNKSGNVL